MDHKILIWTFKFFYLTRNLGEGVHGVVGELLHLLLPLPQLVLGLILCPLPVLLPLVLVQGVPHFAQTFAHFRKAEILDEC